MYNRFIVIDVETTGNLPKRGDRIIQVAAVLIENGKIVEQFSSFVNPGIEIPLFIENLTGITQEMVENAPEFDEIAPKLVQMLDNTCFVAHNVPFDLSFIDEELVNSGYREFRGPSLDTVELSRLLFPTLDSYKLNQLSEYLNIEHDNPHRADSDAEVTAKLLLLLLEKLENLPLQTLKQLKPLVKYFQSNLEPIVTAIVQQKEMRIEEINPELDYYRSLILKMMSDQKVDDTNHNEIGSYREAVEQLPDAMTKFEARDGQLEMMDIVETAFNTESHALIEAGTGIGKSLGYLIPAVIQAKKTGRPVVVSTHTIQLQQQLLERDIPILEKLFPFSVEATILKGRNHYLCLRKFEQYLSTVDEESYDVIFSKAQILVWLVNTDYGDVEELSLPSGGKLLWPAVRSDSNSCLNNKCPWFSRCFYHRSRRKAHQADIIITNHSLLFTDIFSEHSLLPAYKEVILDEAHHLEDVVSKQFGVQTDYHSFLRIIDRIGTLDVTSSYLNKISALLTEYEAPENLIESIVEPNEKLKNIKFEIDDLFRMIKTFGLAQAKNSDSPKLTVRFTPGKGASGLYIQVKDVTQRISFDIKDVSKAFNMLLKFLDEKTDHMTVYQKGQLVDFKGYVSSLEEELGKLTTILLGDSEGDVSWIETDSKGAANTAFLYSQPVEIADLLTENFFKKKHSVIMTSATLTIKNSFNYMLERLGLDGLPVMSKSIASPFDYKEQAQILVPTDIPMIKDVPQKIYVEHITDAIEQIAYVTNGKMLVLFTSYEMLKTTYYNLKESIADEYNLIGQGIDSGSRSKLTKNFKQYDNAILFGTSSFWEGVDIPGDDLSCIVIVRLPFSPPDDPVAQARSERLKQHGKNPFMELSLPQAIIRFKQGFGRLIRTKEDRGVVFVFDGRILKTRYGKNFIASLPDVPVVSDDTQNLLTNLKEWI